MHKLGAHLVHQLDILDTAGADQFQGLSDMYLKVCCGFEPGFNHQLNSRTEWPRIRACIQASRNVTRTVITLTPSYSLTHEASLREIEQLRQQIYRVKGGERVRRSSNLPQFRLNHSAEYTHSGDRHQTRSRQ